MSSRSSVDLEHLVGTWLAEEAPRSRVTYLDETLAKTSRTRQRPAWTFPSRWLPELPNALRLGPLPAWVLILLALLLALLAGTLAVGSLRHLPSPYGLAGNGLVAFDAGDDIVVARPDGSDRRVIAGTGAVETSPVWSPDGTRIAFWRALDTGHWAIVVIDSQGVVEDSVSVGAIVDRSLLSESTTAGTFARGAPSLLSWAPDSRRLAFSQEVSGIPFIWTLALDGGRLARIGDPALPAFDPAWSADGTRIAFRGGGSGDAMGVYVMNADGTNVRRISHVRGGGLSFAAPRWQPGGDLITYFADPDGTSHVFVVRADGTGEFDLSARVRVSGADTWPAWSPDGARIAFVRSSPDGAGGQIVVADLDQARTVVPSHPPVDCGAPVWSPDGRTISAFLYDAEKGGDYAIVSVDLDGQSPPVVVAAPANTGGATWQRLGR